MTKFYENGEIEIYTTNLLNTYLVIEKEDEFECYLTSEQILLAFPDIEC